MNQLLQDLQQVRTICQQLSQNERQNAQLFSQNPGMQVIAQRENFAANQLQNCVSLCNRIEQSLVQNTATASFNSFGSYGQNQFSNYANPVNQAVRALENNQGFSNFGR